MPFVRIYYANGNIDGLTVPSLSYAWMQKIVEGYIDRVPLPGGQTMVVNDAAKKTPGARVNLGIQKAFPEASLVYGTVIVMDSLDFK